MDILTYVIVLVARSQRPLSINLKVS
jgi:hypothetical protein